MNYKNKIAKKVATIIVLLLLSFNYSAFAQLIITPAATSPQQLVQNILVGTGVTVTNVTFNHSNAGQSGTTYWNNFGSFTTGSTPTNLGFSSGLIMASGGVSGAVGPNNSSSSTTAVVPSTPDTGCAVLLALVPGSVLHDAAVLEFDFIPLSDTIKFRYVFGSEEYLEFVNTTFNDVFAFFINGINPAGGNYVNYNIAKVPGTNTAITIDNVNDATNSQYYINNDNGNSLQADGFTTVLTASAVVVPCTPYHLKLAIADRGDRAYDSWVWLESNSFTSPQAQVTTNFAHPEISNNVAIRGCNDAIVKIKYPSAFLYSQQLDITVQGTAIYGTDYVSTPDVNAVYGATGSDSVTIVVSPFDNPTDTAIKTVVLIIPTSICGDTQDTITIYIYPKPLFLVAASGDTTVCDINNQIQVVASGGYSPYHYLWSNGDTTATTIVSPLATSLYYVSVRDACNQIIKDSVQITIFCHFANAGPDTTICVRDTAILHASGGIKYFWNTGNPADTTATIKVTPTISTSYIVTVTNSSNVFTDNDTVEVFTNPLPIVTITPNPSTICLGDSIQLTASGANLYFWTSDIYDSILIPAQQTLSNPFVSPNVNTLYRVLGTDINGCMNKDSAKVNISPLPIPIISVTPNPVSITNPTVYISEQSNTGSSWLWFTGDGGSSNVRNFYHTYSDQDTGRYLVRLILTNDVGCVDSTSMWVIVAPDTRLFIPNAFTPGKPINNVFRVYGSGIYDFQLFIYDRWGVLVFSTNDMEKGWDGTFKSEVAPTGVYAYKILYKNTSNQNKQQAGSLTLLR